MYTGRYYHKLDAKSRFSLPTVFRKALGKKIIVTKGLDGCLFIFDEREWAKKMDEASRLEYTKKTHRDFVRLLTNDAIEVELDTHGRILLPTHLKEQGKLTKDLVIVGSLDRVEIWDQAAYHQYLSGIEQKAEEIAENVTVKAI